MRGMFGVEDRIEISPLFETEEAFERGERVIEEALKSPHYRAYLERQGRLAVQFGFSDSGRFIGQMAATFRIERLRLRLAQLLERHGLSKLEAILFNTHGESIGRGGHPSDLRRSPALCGAAEQPRGVRAARSAGQGGDKFSGRRRLSAVPDAGRGAREHAADSGFRFRRERRDRQRSDLRGAGLQRGILRDGAAGVHRPGRRSGLRGVAGPVRREPALSDRVAAGRARGEEWGRPSRIEHPSQLRAIPNNAILQQLGFMAITLHGIGRAVSKDPELFPGDAPTVGALSGARCGWSRRRSIAPTSTCCARM